tara:strand:- start:335 stop:511 length:177 start_codon:yes stop_codon:yes gene_type:complete
MSEEVKIKANTKEEVAYKLTMDIASREKLYESNDTYREKLLDLYAECLYATNGYRDPD